MKKLNKGFTLIELLVVIAIIGILSAVVLASLNSARNKGADAAAKSDLNNARAQAELFYSNGNTYDGVCTASSTDSGISQLVAAAQAVAGDAGADACDDETGAYAAQVLLKSAKYYCVDSTGYGGEQPDAKTADATACQ